MSKAVKCPVCEGKGKVSSMVGCCGCQGKGWVEVSEAELELLAEPNVLNVNVNITLPGDKLPPEIDQKILEILRKEIEKGKIRQSK